MEERGETREDEEGASPCSRGWPRAFSPKASVTSARLRVACECRLTRSGRHAMPLAAAGASPLHPGERCLWPCPASAASPQA